MPSSFRIAVLFGQPIRLDYNVVKDGQLVTVDERKSLKGITKPRKDSYPNVVARSPEGDEAIPS